MHDFIHFLPNLLTSIGTLIGAIVILYKAYGTSHKNNFSELNQEVKQKEEDAEIYRARWIKAEQANDELRKQIDRLRKELDHAKHKSN